MNDQTLWMPIVGYPNYLISTNGDIKSLPKKRGRGIGHLTKEVVLKSQADSCGYSYVKLSIFSKKYHALVHRLVALAFIENIHNKPCVNHIDGNKKNNALSNLEWCTYSENEQHAIRSGLKSRMGLGKSTITQDIYSRIVELKNAGLSQLEIAKTFGTNQPTISKIFSGKIKPLACQESER